MGPVLEQKPLEVIIPPSRGWLAKMASLAPELGSRTFKLLQRRGRSQQRKASLG
jgi:hypothetical protein